MKTLITVFALIFTTHAFSGENPHSRLYTADEIIRDIQNYRSSGKASAELAMQVKSIMRTEKVSREEAIKMLQELALDMKNLKY